MSEYKIFCMCLHNHHLQNLKNLKYTPVGLGENDFSDEWVRDNTKTNISHKNKYYGEYTFYYWFWKNILNEIKDGTWIGFSGYRYHWSQKSELKSEEISDLIDKDNFENYILKKIPDKWKNYDVILGEKIPVNNWKFSKIFKHAKKKFLLNPSYFIKKNQNIKLHFDVFHGDGYLDKAITALDPKERKDFKDFINKNYSFNRENLFFCKSNKLFKDYFNSIFNWLEACESFFGFDLEGYAKTRIYAFLAERYLSYWFNKYSKPLDWPIFFFDTNINKIQLK